MSSLVGKAIYSELQSIANGIGKSHNGRYIKEDDALDCVKDLIKSLRRENETCDIRRFLGLAQVLQEDLLPLITNYGSEDEELFEITMRCLMNLTQPARIVFKNEVPQDKINRHCYIETESYLQDYKQSFVNREFLDVLSEKLAALLELNWEDRSEEQNVLIERILVLLRNVLHVPATDADKLRTDDDASTHDQVIWHMHQTGLDKLILYIASSDDERRFCIHVLEIISLMFRDQTPEQLASAGASRSRREKDRDVQELARVADMEKAQKRAQLLKLTSRHSRFGGTYIMKGTKSIAENDMIYHRPLNGLKEHTYDSGKKMRKKPKNRKPIEGDEVNRRSTLSIRVCLKEFCVEFIKNCYNPLMRAVKSALDRDSTQENDETYYLWSMRFFMQFQRLYHFDVELVRETMSVQDFHYVHTMLLNHQDMMAMDKKDAIIWGKRLHLALRSYKELLETLQAMATSPSSQIRDSSKVIQQNVFYMQEYRDVLGFLFKKFDNSRHSKLYARDLVETTHIYVRTMDKWCASQGKVLVQKKKKKIVRRKKPVRVPVFEEPQLSQEQLEEKWEGLAEELSDLLQGVEELDEEVTPFDATSDVTIDEQRQECVRSIYEAMHNGNGAQAAAMLRAAREVWSDNEEFGCADISPEDEFMLLREVFFADIPRRQANPPAPEHDEEFGEEMEEEMEEEEQEVAHEQEFDFKQFLRTFSSPRVVRVYALLLTQYKTNSVHTNHCIIKMLHRIAVQNGMVAFLFQLSLFRTFQKIFKDDCTKAPQFTEMRKFALYVIHQFFKCAEKNPKIYVEMLFWKNAKECHEVMEGYGSYKEMYARAKSVAWTEEEQEELRQLYEEHKEGEGDIVDKIMVNLIDSTRTRRQVVRQLILMDLVTNSKQLKKGISGGVRWRENEMEWLKELYDIHRNDSDPVGEIMVKMDKPRRQIVNKIVELGLVEDRKLLRKGRKNLNLNRESSGEESGSEATDEDQASGPAHEFARLTRGEPQELLAQLREIPSMEYSLTWVQRSLNRAADDREDEDEEPVATPLIPLMEECEMSLQDELFQRFLYTIGINPPTNEQEQFWRISLELSPSQLRQLADVIQADSTSEWPQLDIQYNLPSARSPSHKKTKKKKRREVDGDRERQPRTKVITEPAKAPISKEFISDESSSDNEDGNWWERRQELPEELREERRSSLPSISDVGSGVNSDTDQPLIASHKLEEPGLVLPEEFAWLTRGEPQELLAQLLEIHSMEYSLTWVQRSLNRAADDREDEDEEPVATPLIPLMEECEMSLQDELFQRFLYTIGINPPTNEQEQFWRISLVLTAAQLRKIADAIGNSDVEFPPLAFSTRNPATHPEKRKTSQRRQRTKKRPAANVEKRKRSAKRSKLNVAPRRGRLAVASDDSESSQENITYDAESDKENTTHNPESDKENTTRNPESDKENTTHNPESDKENTTHKPESDEENTTHDTSMASEMSDSATVEESYQMPIFESFPATALTQPYPDSSDSDDDHITLASAMRTKRKAAVLSDDSD